MKTNTFHQVDVLAPVPAVSLGDQSGRVVVVGAPFWSRDGKNRRHQTVVCLCECGRHAAIRCTYIKSKSALSCGCRSGNTQHGFCRGLFIIRDDGTIETLEGDDG